MKVQLFKNYGSIGHLPGSRLGPGDHHISEGQAAIMLEKQRDYKDLVIVQEKLDGANVGVIRQNGELIALTRKGHRACDSPLTQFQMLHHFIARNEHLFDYLDEGERVCGEWLAMAHGTKYDLKARWPLVIFDLFTKDNKRYTYVNMCKRIGRQGVLAPLLHIGSPISIKKAEKLLGTNGHYGALEEAEGVVYRVERDGQVDFLGKYVRANKVDGKYFNQDESQLIWNWTEESQLAA